MEIVRRTPWSRIREQNSVNKEVQEIVGKGKVTGCFRKETMAVSDTTRISVQNRHRRIFLRALLRGRVKIASRTQSPSGRRPSGKMARLPCKDYLKGTCAAPFCENWHPPECLFYKSEKKCRFVEKCSYAHRQVDEQPSNRFNKNGDQSAVAMLKITRQLGVAYFKIWSRRSLHRFCGRVQAYWNQSDVRFTKAISRDQNPSLGMICPHNPHQRNPNAPKFEYRSQEETEWQERCAREAAWKLAKSVFSSRSKKEQHSSHRRKIGAFLHQILDLRNDNLLSTLARQCTWSAKKDLSDAEIDTLTKSCSPTIVITANGEVQTHEEAIVHVKELDIFLTMKVLGNTPAVLSLGKFCDENGYSYSHEESLLPAQPFFRTHKYGETHARTSFVPKTVIKSRNRER